MKEPSKQDWKRARRYGIDRCRKLLSQPVAVFLEKNNGKWMIVGLVETNGSLFNSWRKEWVSKTLNRTGKILLGADARAVIKGKLAALEAEYRAL